MTFVDGARPPGGGYDDIEIELLTLLQAIRRRPEMYIGTDPSRRGDLTLATVIADHLRAAAHGPVVITVTVEDDWVCKCVDNGQGMPSTVDVAGVSVDLANAWPNAGPAQGQLIIARAMAKAMTFSSTHDGRRWARVYGPDEKSRWFDLGAARESGASTEIELDRALVPNGVTSNVFQHPVCELLAQVEWLSHVAYDELLRSVELRLIDHRT